MSFSFVDRIIEHQPGQFLRAIKNVCRNESLFYWLPDGRRVLSPAVISESVAQTGASLKMATTNFQFQPVLLASDDATYSRVVEPGDQIEMFVRITQMDLERHSITSSGQALVNGELVYQSECSRAFLLPLADYRDPIQTQKRFVDLFKPELKDAHLGAEVGIRLPAIAGHQTFESLRLLDGLLHHTPGKRVKSYKNVTSCETYFIDHFPRKPVVPGVMLLAIVGESCQYLLRERLDAPPRQRALIPNSIGQVRFRKFVEPGDRVITDVQVVKGDPRLAGSDIVIKAQMHANGARVLQAVMGMSVQHAKSHEESE